MSSVTPDIPFKLLVQSVVDYAIFMLDPEGTVSSWNVGAERIKGYSSDEIVGKHFSSFYTKEDRKNGVPKEVLETARREGRYEGEGWRVRKDGSRFWASVVIDAIHGEDGKLIGFAKVTRDMSEKREAQLRLEESREQLFRSQKMEALGQLTGGLAHDFNNLLTGILGNADLLAILSPPESDQRRAAEAIVIGAQRAADLVSKMLAYSGGGRVVAQHVNLDELVKEMVDLLSASVARHCTLIYNSPGPLPLVETDPTQIRQVVLNLIVNASEAVDDHGVITVETGEESIDREMLKKMTFGDNVTIGRYVFIDVVDNGVGMDEHTMTRMFDPFFSTKDAGRGLGMAAVRGIVRSHRAALRVTSAKGQGTRFRVWFPLGLSIHSTSDASDVTRGQSTPS